MALYDLTNNYETAWYSWLNVMISSDFGQCTFASIFIVPGTNNWNLNYYQITLTQLAESAFIARRRR